MPSLHEERASSTLRQAVASPSMGHHLLAWSHFAFGRAVVPTLMLVALGALFIVVPQTAEVLRNLHEVDLATAPLGAQTLLGVNLSHWAFTDTDFLFLAMTSLTAAWLGLGTWVSVRTPFTQHVPPYLKPHPQLQAWAGRHLTFVVSAALVLMLGAFLQSAIPMAPGAPRAMAIVGWAWAATPLLAMYAVRVGQRLNGRGGNWLAPLVGLLVLAGYSAGTILAFGMGARSSVCNLAAATLPALGYGLVTYGLDFARQHGDADAALGAWVGCWVVLILFTLTLQLFIALSPVNIIQSYGSASLVLMLLCGLFVIGVVLSAGLRTMFREVAGATLAVALVVLLALWGLLPERYGEEHAPTTVAPVGHVHSPTSARQSKRRSWAEAPVGQYVAVHADGGGIRAAYFTAMALAAADDMTCGQFGDHVFAASGVSGGSLGLATWAALRQELVEHGQADPSKRWASCDPAAMLSAPVRPVLQSLVKRTLVRDHLSPTLARMIGTDALPMPWRPAERGQALLDSWQSAALDALREAGFTAASEVFARPLSATDAGLNPAPWLLLNATDALTGNRVAQLNSGPVPLLSKGARPATTTALGVATLDSARFPYISPAGKVLGSEGTTRRLLVDGGYFDNSGAASLRELLLSSDIAKPPGNLHILRLEGNPSDGERMRCEQLLGTKLQGGHDRPNWAGLSAYFNARTAHANEAVALLHTLALTLSNNSTTYKPGKALTLTYASGFEETGNGANSDAAERRKKANIEACQASLAAVEAPLGWYLSGRTAQFMQKSIEASAKQLVKAAGFN